MSDAGLLARGARRHAATAADAPLMPPCRVSLRDARPGEVSILLPWAHHAAPTSPYRASGPIFVRQGARETARFVNPVPDQQRVRLLSVRAYDADEIMVDAEVAPGAELEALIARFFGRPEVVYTCTPTTPGAAATPAASTGPDVPPRVACPEMSSVWRRARRQSW